MATEYIAFVTRSKLPPTSDLVRAMCSRGFLVEVDTEESFAELSGKVPVRVDGEALDISVEVGPVEPGAMPEADVDPSVVRQVVKNTDTRITFKADGASAGWARDLARAVGLLACGAFANPAEGKLINFGR
ncbi:MAG: hypothetical protein VX265_10610 [Myxococcota bacterium]|nr:hypothetical protein [Myxococcota bacterium]MEC8422460.1 hypothetical protein [Myxococcota bacterium]